jgi:hypothetical protein
MTDAQFEVRVDGTPRTYRDRKDYAMEAARLIKNKNPHSIAGLRGTVPASAGFFFWRSTPVAQRASSDSRRTPPRGDRRAGFLTPGLG